MVNKITTPPTQNEVIDKINELVDGKQDTLVSGTNIKTVGGTSLLGSGNVAFPTVDQTYSATSANAQSGVAVANAIAPKQDTLVSGTNIKTINGNSLLGSGNITIETSSTPNVDGETISYNSSDALQAIAVKNVRDGSTLPIWHGTEYQWNHGDPTTWYYWQTSVTALWTSGGDLPYLGNNSIDITYGNGIFVVIDTEGNVVGTDNQGETWNTLTKLPSFPSGIIDVWLKITFGNNKFAVISNTSAYIAYSEDNCQTWTIKQTGITSTYDSVYSFIYANNKFILNYGSIWGETRYSEDLINWSNAFTHRGACVTYGNNRFIGTYNGRYWSQSQDLDNWTNYNYGEYRYIGEKVAYGNGKFISVHYEYISSLDDNSDVWNYRYKQIPISGSLIAYGNGIFMIVGTEGQCCYSSDGGDNWVQSQHPLNNTSLLSYGNSNFIAINNTTEPFSSAIFTITYDKCYTDTANPTTSSVVYSEPNVTSSYTISSVTSGAITLSNNNTYYYNQSGNVQTYDTIGNSHPEYLCFIDGVGVKMGNTMIATNTPITTTITSSSTDTEAPSAKAVYDALNP